MKTLSAIIVFFIVSTLSVSGQWSNGYDIYNSTSGNVGINTTSPQSKLHLNGNGLSSGAPILILQNYNATGLVGSLRFASGYNNFDHWSGIEAYGTGGVDQQDLRFYTTYGTRSEKMRIDGAGQVGLGTTTPYGRLNIKGFTNNSSTSALYVQNSTGAQMFNILDNGYVGVGTTPVGLFNVQGDPTVAGNEVYLSGLKTGDYQNTNSLRLNFVGYQQSAGFGIQAINTGSYGTKDLVFYAHDGNKYPDYTSYDEVIRFKSNGNVGIGTQTATTKLGVYDATNITTFTGNNNQGLRLYGGNNASGTSYSLLGFASGQTGFDLNVAQIGARITGSGSYIQFGTSNNYTTGITNTAMTIDYNGKIGIGTQTPNGKLDVVNGSAYTSFMANSTGKGDLLLFGGLNGMNFSLNAVTTSAGDLKTDMGINLQVDGGTGATNYAVNGSKYAPTIRLNAQDGSISLLGENGTGNSYRIATYNPGVFVKGNGFVGIGTSSPLAQLDVTGNIFTNSKILIGTTDLVKAGSYSLAVNGDAIFKKVRVLQYASWPDFVFEEKYGLLPLEDVEQFIKANKHLPEVPTAAEVEKDGIDIGSTQTILLQKIEELTLYAIEQNKKAIEQDKKATAQQEQINLLLKELSAVKEQQKKIN